MVAESMVSEDYASQHDRTMALDDEGLPVHQNEDPSLIESVARTTEPATTGQADEAAAPGQPSSSETEQPQVTPPVATLDNANPAAASSASVESTDSSYHLKWINWNSGSIPIVMQSTNGPCPLIAIMNVLLLREKVKLPSMLEQITESQLLAYIGECIMDSVPAEAQNDENILVNMEQNIHDAIEILPKLKSGLDVNIRFTGITDFEYTPECIIFDLLRIPLYHGWLCDPDLAELQEAIRNQSYNQLVDNIITNKTSQDPTLSTQVLLAEDFLERTASQLTAHGLSELKRKIKDNEIGILFRNNHFLALFKREGDIYTLVTDHGYLTEDNIIWETLDSVEGAGRFFDCNFQLSEVTNRQVSELKAIDERQQQMVNDYLVALSLSRDETGNGANTDATSGRQLELDDLEVARRLQAEEDAQYEEMVRKRQTTSIDPNVQPSSLVESSSTPGASSPHLGTASRLNSQESRQGLQATTAAQPSSCDQTTHARSQHASQADQPRHLETTTPLPNDLSPSQSSSQDHTRGNNVDGARPTRCNNRQKSEKPSNCIVN